MRTDVAREYRAWFTPIRTANERRARRSGAAPARGAPRRRRRPRGAGGQDDLPPSSSMSVPRKHTPSSSAAACVSRTSRPARRPRRPGPSARSSASVPSKWMNATGPAGARARSRPRAARSRRASGTAAASTLVAVTSGPGPRSSRAPVAGGRPTQEHPVALRVAAATTRAARRRSSGSQDLARAAVPSIVDGLGRGGPGDDELPVRSRPPGTGRRCRVCMPDRHPQADACRRGSRSGRPRAAFGASRSRPAPRGPRGPAARRPGRAAAARRRRT